MPGSGKSWTALTLSEILDKDFDITHVAFTPKQYLDVLKDAKRGQFVVWDECGVALHSRKWFSASNILITEVLQTMRHKRLGVIMVVPDMSFIDIQARKLVHSYCESKRRGYHPVNLWIYEINVNRRTGEIYYPHPLINDNGNAFKLRKFIVKRRPSKELCKEYEKQHVEYKNKIEHKARKDLSAVEAEMFGEETTIFDYINKVTKNKEEYSKNNKVNVYVIQTKLGISRHKAEQIKAMIGTNPNPQKKV